MIPRLWFLLSVLWTGFIAAVLIDGKVDPSTNMDARLGVVLAIVGLLPWGIRRAARWVFWGY